MTRNVPSYLEGAQNNDERKNHKKRQISAAAGGTLICRSM